LHASPSMRVPRRQVPLFTSRWSDARFSVTAILMVVTTACFLVQVVAGFYVPDATIKHTFALTRSGILSGHYWQLLTYMFIHGGPIHLLLNMVTLYFVGRQLEDLLGWRHYLGIYFGGGLLGGIAHLVFSPHAAVLGASAGVAAALIAFTTILPEIELTLLVFFVLPIRMRAKFLAIGFVAISALLLLTSDSSVSHLAHLGGALLGWIYVKQLGYGNPLRIQAYFWKRRREAERREHMTADQYISEEIDPILDKISREGIHSLTRAERKILERGRNKIAERTSTPGH
jgi:membrane associated rhomboid family serine protease